VLREQPNCFAIALTPSPRRAITRISTASSWVNIDGSQKAAILAQVGHFYFGAVGQYYSGANTQFFALRGIGLGRFSKIRSGGEGQADGGYASE
jgi:hypothetical protein